MKELISTFWFEDPTRRKRLEDGLRGTLAQLMPESVETRISSQITRIRTKAGTDLRNGISAYENTLAELAAARAALEQQRNNLPQHQAEIARDRLAFRKEIDSRRESTKRFLKDQLDTMASPQHIEQFIRSNFNDSREDAKRETIPLLLEGMQGKLEKHLRESADALAPSLEKYTQKYRLMAGVMNVPEPDEFEGIDLEDDTQDGWRKRIFALGGANRMFTGLISKAVNLTSTLVVGLLSFFGVDWRPRLAKKIAETLQEKNLLAKVRERVEAFWDTNWKNFEAGADALEARFLEYMTKNEELLKGNSEEKVRAAIASL